MDDIEALTKAICEGVEHNPKRSKILSSMIRIMKDDSEHPMANQVKISMLELFTCLVNMCLEDEDRLIAAQNELDDLGATDLVVRLGPRTTMSPASSEPLQRFSMGRNFFLVTQ